jgi:ABC-type proline/glycine betaine transport system permease subunit
MAFLALVVREGGVSFLPLLVVIVLLLKEVDENVLDAMKSLGVEELQGILGSWQMAVHTVGHKTLLVVHMS